MGEQQVPVAVCGRYLQVAFRVVVRVLLWRVGLGCGGESKVHRSLTVAARTTEVGWRGAANGCVDISGRASTEVAAPPRAA